MSKENQITEWKQSWHENYFDWICGYANAFGGTLYIGKDDDGNVVGIDNIEKLLELVPNKTRDLMGIMVDVNHHEEGGLHYLEIVVEPYPYPINIRGRYFYRSGSTKQELKGPALNKFLLERQGKRWDGVPVPNVSVDELKDDTIEFFKRKAAKSNRLSEEDLDGDKKEIIESLNLFDSEMLKRAAVLLFHPDPEKFVTGAFIKIGFFEEDDDLKYQDEVKGNLLEQAEEVLMLLKTKYDVAAISYDEGSRYEKFTFPQDAIREAVMNAIAHKDYSSGIPIQISVYNEKIIFWNEGQLPENWTVDKLSSKHPSKPFNPDIANTLFRAGYIESWGRGTIKMINACKEHKIAPPIFSNEPPDFQVELIKYSDHGLSAMGLKEELRKVVLYTQEHESITNTQVQELCGVSKATASRYLSDLEGKYIEKVGTTGVGTSYILKGLAKGS
ncbi:MAG: putative DNA binding domain-containing protein [Crocinitomicaceae bacterium]|nr:putative DNA binding domain-containing protein [Crocinitomicaceae bacterium]